MSVRHSFALFMTGAAVALLTGCETSDPQPTGLEPSAQMGGVSASATGGGELLITIADGFEGRFTLGVVQTGPGDAARGQFHYSLVFFGELIEFFGEATCLTVDPVNNRAWVGGIVTRNNSTHPAFTEPRHDPGRDIWFRVVDYGEGANAGQSDRTTFVGFEGDAGIITSAEYCEVQPWPDDDARTWEVTKGNIQVR